MSEYELQIDLPEYKKGCRFEKTDVVKGWQLVDHKSGVDEDGYKFSSGYAETISAEMADWLNDHYVDEAYLKPVKAEPKYEVELYDQQEIPQIIINLNSPAPFDQAQLIKKAIEADMKYIMGEFDEMEYPCKELDKARQSMSLKGEE